MCLAKLYLSEEGGEPTLENIAHMRLQDDGVEVETLFGESRVIRGKLRQVDFAKSRIIVEERP